MAKKNGKESVGRFPPRRLWEWCHRFFGRVIRCCPAAPSSRQFLAPLHQPPSNECPSNEPFDLATSARHLEGNPRREFVCFLAADARCGYGFVAALQMRNLYVGAVASSTVTVCGCVDVGIGESPRHPRWASQSASESRALLSCSPRCSGILGGRIRMLTTRPHLHGHSIPKSKLLFSSFFFMLVLIEIQIEKSIKQKKEKWKISKQVAKNTSSHKRKKKSVKFGEWFSPKSQKQCEGFSLRSHNWWMASDALSGLSNKKWSSQRWFGRS